MKFKNVSDKVKMFKEDDEWVSVQPGKVIELSEAVAESEGNMELVKEKPKKKGSKKAKKEAKAKPKSKEELDKMTKDQLNDYAAKNGLDKISSRMKKPDMIKSILRFLKKWV